MACLELDFALFQKFLDLQEGKLNGMASVGEPSLPYLIVNPFDSFRGNCDSQLELRHGIS